MRVKVTHTLDLEDTPVFAEQLLQSANRRLSKANDELAYTLRSAQDIAFLVERLEKVREQLSLAETQIQDGLNIMVGHHNALIKMQEEEDVAETEREEAPDDE